jgi:hypothetical protein
VGQLFHDKEADVWYECIFDTRKNVFTWTILPPEKVLPGMRSRWDDEDGGCLWASRRPAVPLMQRPL